MTQQVFVSTADSDGSYVEEATGAVFAVVVNLEPTFPHLGERTACFVAVDGKSELAHLVWNHAQV